VRRVVSQTASIAVFTDVDQVLTLRPINIELARILGVEGELSRIERAFYAGGTTDAFNAEFLPLFRSRTFTKMRAEECFDSVALRGKASQLLRVKGADVYLVSSGPSYYIDLLAQRHGIPPERRTCSRYEFDDHGTLGTKVDAVDSQEKAQFVRRYGRKYRTTIGLGNSRVLDGAFLALCDIPILLADEVDNDFLTVNALAPVVRLIEALADNETTARG
jgi:phosphoserine phosphatase